MGHQTNREGESIVRTAKGWFFQRLPVFLFLFIFGALLSLSYVVMSYNMHLLSSYRDLIAKLSGVTLELLGQDIIVSGKSISSPRFSIRIIHGCDATEATAFFICAVLAFPLPFSKKVLGVIAGTLFLAILNLIRIVSLFLIGTYFPKVFDVMHIEIWQSMFIAFAIVLWILWLLWAAKS